MKFVAYSIEHLRDGIEECAMIFDNRDAALKWINRLRDGFGGCNRSFRLFNLGEELPLSIESIEEPQPPKVIQRFV